MAATECGHGHIYDSDIYASCPYCNSAQPIINFAASPAGGGGMGAAYSSDKTAPLGGGYGPSAAYAEDKTAPLGGGYGGTAPLNGFGGAAATADDKTRPPVGYQPAREKRADEDQHTVGIMKKKMGLEPVVGWLVCVDGKDKGKDYKLWGRINTIGSSEKMDVCIKGDPSISREDHARLGYEPKHSSYHLIPAASKNPIYLNEQVVYTPMQLSAYDVLEFGETKLIFVPLCSSRFNWEDGVKDAGGGKE